jgi:hypothetical protein
MDKETEVATTSEETVEEELTPEEEGADEPKAEESEIEVKNRQLYERAKKAEAEAKELKARLLERESEEDSYEPHDSRLTDKIKELDSKLSAIQEKAALDNLYLKYPILKDKFVEFDEYRLQNPGMSMEVGAKAFLVEHDLLNATPKRKGLEKAGGGRKTAPTTSMSVEDAKRLRENNYAEYKKQLMAGKIQIS